jgi:hypothetical protein
MVVCDELNKKWIKSNQANNTLFIPCNGKENKIKGGNNHGKHDFLQPFALLNLHPKFLFYCMSITL